MTADVFKNYPLAQKAYEAEHFLQLFLKQSGINLQTIVDFVETATTGPQEHKDLLIFGALYRWLLPDASRRDVHNFEKIYGTPDAQKLAYQLSLSPVGKPPVSAEVAFINGIQDILTMKAVVGQINDLAKYSASVETCQKTKALAKGTLGQLNAKEHLSDIGATKLIEHYEAAEKELSALLAPATPKAQGKIKTPGL